MIEVKNLSAQTSKGLMLLDHVGFILKPGTCTGLTGASGSGKTTLLKAEAAEKVDTTAYIWYNVIIKYRRWYHG